MREQSSLATEDEFATLFRGCEAGAMAPFGNMYGMDVYVSDLLAAEEEISFNACSHRELVKMSYNDFEKLVQPKVMELTES